MRFTMFAAAFLGLAPWAFAQEEEVTKETAASKKEQPLGEETKESTEKPISKNPEDAVVVNLLYGAKKAAGSVAVWNDGETLFVEYRASGQWTIHKTRLDVELDPEDIPQNKKGSPLPGKFEFKDKHGEDGVTEFLYEIPLADMGWSSGDIVYVAANAKVSELEKDGSITKEVAWGDGEDFPGPKWGMYFAYEIEGPGKKKPEAPSKEETEKPAPSKVTKETESKEEALGSEESDEECEEGGESEA